MSNFSTPTTQAEMHEILKEIFSYYRVRWEGFKDVELKELELTRMEYVELSDAELEQKARALIAGNRAQFESEYRGAITEELAVLNAKIDGALATRQARENKAELDFNDSVEKINAEICKNGLEYSSVAVDKLAELETQKNRLLSEILLEYNQEVAELNAKKINCQNKLDGAEEYCGALTELEVSAKKLELIDEQAETIREVFKYNNGLDEKEQRYANKILETNASLRLRFMEIRSGEYTKDELVNMGYYEDVIECVCAYYDTLPIATAYQQISTDKVVAVYLDDYYDSIIYMYQQRYLS